MSSGRLPAQLEVTALLRKVQAAGGFATVLRKGDPESGALLLIIESRGKYLRCLERVLSLEGSYEWQAAGPGDSASSEEVQAFLAKRRRFDTDAWLIELDIADAERFIAETTLKG